MKTAGIIIIGDEILNGTVIDSNSSWLCHRFHLLGILVRRISVVPDEIFTIAEELKKFSSTFDFVVTTGGVGPTHDDVTYEGVAAAFGVDLRVDASMQRFYDFYLEDTDQFALRLVTIPSNAEVIFANLERPLENGKFEFPVVKVQNVFVMPGIPTYMQTLFESLEQHYFQNSSAIFFSRILYLNVDEIEVLPILNKAVRNFKDKVTFGSYPISGESSVCGASAKIYVESNSLSDCLDAESELLSGIPPQWSIYVPSKMPDFKFIHRLASYEGDISNAMKLSLQVIEACFKKYDVSETFISFNGGKDCTALLNLICYYLWKEKIKKPLSLVYFKENDSFIEVDSFIELIKNEYENINLHILPQPMKRSLSEFLKSKPKIKVGFLGLRSVDPTSKNLNHVQETDPDWPKLIRISPILHWSYKNVWDFLRGANIPYCSLYHRGFTSLGSKSNTNVNPLLEFDNKDRTVSYKPAFLLTEDKYERDGRQVNGMDTS